MRTSPSGEESAVEPVPEEVRDELARTIRAVVHWQSHSYADQHVLELAQAHLQLRDPFPLRHRTGDELTVRDDFHDWSPCSPESARERGTAGNTNVRRLVALPQGRLVSRMQLQEGIFPQRLSRQHERLED